MDVRKSARVHVPFGYRALLFTMLLVALTLSAIGATALATDDIGTVHLAANESNPVFPDTGDDQPTQPDNAFIYLPLLANTPSVFSNPHPARDSVRQSVNSYLTWDLDESLFPAKSYTILFNKHALTNDVVLVQGIERSQYSPGITFEPNTLYEWQIVAYDGNGNEARSPIWRFRTDYLSGEPEPDAMVYIPEGEFYMGCDATIAPSTCVPGHGPLHAVWISGFQMDKYEVSNREYQRCVAAGVCGQPRRFGSEVTDYYYNNPAYANYPVLYVSKINGDEYCNWQGKRLPTEAEWEKAARGAIDTRSWPWGEEPFDCTRGNLSQNRCGVGTQPVSSNLPGQSPYGVINMTGNAYEWTADRNGDFYPNSPYVNPLNSRGGYTHVIRGGAYTKSSWFYGTTYHRQFAHHGDPGTFNDAPFFRSYIVGFRCVLPDDPNAPFNGDRPQ